MLKVCGWCVQVIGIRSLWQGYHSALPEYAGTGRFLRLYNGIKR